MARRPLRTKEQIAAVPLDQDVVLDLTPDDPVIPIIDDTTPTNGVAAPTPVREPSPPPERDPEGDKLALKKQADDLRAAEERAAKEVQAENERRHQEALAQQQRSHELDTYASRTNSEYNQVITGISRFEAQATAAQSEYENAAAVGDFKAMGAAQRKISRCEAELVSLENGRVELEYRLEELKRNPPQLQQQQQPQMTMDQRFEAHIQQYPDVIKTWMRGHRDYMEPGMKNDRLQRATLDAKIDGIPLYTQDHIDYIEKQLGMRQSDDEAPDLEPARRTPVSAPVSRESVSPGSGRPVTSRINLTAEERQFARDVQPNMDPGEAERLYAQNKLKLLEAKKNGQYRE